MTRRPLPLLAGFALAGSLGLTACGGGSGSGSDATVPVDADLVVTAVPSLRWDLSGYSAPAGEITVALKNEDTVRHDLIILDGETKVGSLDLVAASQGDVATGTITLESGTYTIFCKVPGHSQMKAELTVG